MEKICRLSKLSERKFCNEIRWAKIGSHKLLKRENRITLLFTAFSRWSAGVGHVLLLENTQEKIWKILSKSAGKRLSGAGRERKERICVSTANNGSYEKQNSPQGRGWTLRAGKNEWSEQGDSNPRPIGPKPIALPSCAMLRGGFCRKCRVLYLLGRGASVLRWIYYASFCFFPSIWEI